MASSPISSWQIDGGKVETVTDFIFLGSKITVDSDLKRRLVLGRKAMTNLDSILKSRDITLPTKVRIVKAIVVGRILRCLSSLSFSYEYVTFQGTRDLAIVISNQFTLS